MGHPNAKATNPETHIAKYRKVNGLTIYFATKTSIYATDGKVTIVLERWFDGKDWFYEHNWKPMNQILVKKKGIKTIYDIWKIADYYGVCRHQSFRFPDIKAGAIEIKEDNSK